MRVLFVGTDNVCASPLAAALLFEQQQHRGISDLRVASAGLGPEGKPIAAPIADLLVARRVDVTRKRSRTLDRSMVTPADLILTTTNAIAQRVIADYEGVVSRCFPLVRFCESLDTREATTTPASWLRQQCAATHRRSPNAGGVDLPEPDLEDGLAVLELADQVMFGLMRFLDAGWPDSAP